MHVFGEQAMRADDDVDFAGFEAGEDLFLLRGGAEAAEHFDAHGKCGEAALEGFQMLEGQNGGGGEKGDLLVVHDGFEGGAHGDFGFAVANVAAEETVHGRGVFHVALNVGDGGVLVGGLFEFESVFEFALEISVGSEGESGRGFARGVEGKELVGHVFEGFAYASFAGVPAGAAELVERGMGAFDDAIALDQVHTLEGDVEARVFGVAKQHEFAAAAVGFDLAQALELADAVIDVDDEIAGLELGEIAEETGGANLAAGALDAGSDFEKIGVAEEREFGFGENDAIGKWRADEEQCGGFLGGFGGEARGSVFGFAEDVGNLVFATDVGETLELAGAGGGEKDGAAGGELSLDFAHAGDDIAVEAGAGTGSDFELRSRADVERELLESDLRGFCQGGGELFFGPKIMLGGGGVGLTVALVVFDGGGEMLGGGFAKRGGLVEENDGAEGAFGEFEQCAGAWIFPGAEER